MDEGAFILDQKVVHLDTLDSRRKRRRQDVESNVITKNKSENSRDSLEIITPGGHLDGGVHNTMQNAIWDIFQRDNLVQNEHTFDLNFKQLYRPIEG